MNKRCYVREGDLIDSEYMLIVSCVNGRYEFMVFMSDRLVLCGTG